MKIGDVVFATICGELDIFAITHLDDYWLHYKQINHSNGLHPGSTGTASIKILDMYTVLTEENKAEIL